ncbi:uncharacterized protein LY79DRAFT_581372 [Colletotrichum navitas]|uniref:Uncharacterized protein n=1 Tax=Colletotrichum navitas TaxID=681940 RepID=A0AAD8PVP4_9PEZI|nr:uncharacterized protein LY79DRAFT_581372 [Colletotrichum navitas]KAK1584910.1 hypothetical protein LY79DRAFT_581372 [Colletotrichum navitas]
MRTATGSARRWRTAFAYDFNAGRADDRRSTICNGTWSSNNNRCPERAGTGNIAQHLPRYSGGVWPEVNVLPPTPGLQIFTIQGYTDANGQHYNSNLAYTCDEWPAVPWVEGGSGLPRYGGTQAYTRCAPQKTCDGLKSEQDW